MYAKACTGYAPVPDCVKQGMISTATPDILNCENNPLVNSLLSGRSVSAKLTLIAVPSVIPAGVIPVSSTEVHVTPGCVVPSGLGSLRFTTFVNERLTK